MKALLSTKVRGIHLVAMLIACVIGLLGNASAQVSFADAPAGGPDRIFYSNYRIETAATTGGTGTFLTKTFTAAATDGTALADDSNTTYTVMPGAVARTMKLAFAEADSDNPTVVFKVVGINQFHRTATEHFTCVGDATIVGKVAFLPNPTPVVYVESGGASIENTDTLNINLWGVGLESDPQSATQVGGLAINGARINPATNFSTRFSTAYASWGPASASDLPDNASFEIHVLTASKRSSYVMECWSAE